MNHATYVKSLPTPDLCNLMLEIHRESLRRLNSPPSVVVVQNDGETELWAKGTLLDAKLLDLDDRNPENTDRAEAELLEQNGYIQVPI